jgi:ABC-type Na+ efflux pump permease subunit
MGFLFATFKKDLARWRQDYVAILIWLGIPFMIGGLITAMVDGGDDGGPMGTLLIADIDDTLVSGFVAAAFGQDELSGLLGTKMVTVDEGTALIEAGDASGFLIIPAGFQDALINDTPVVLTLKTNPSQTILPGIIEDIIGVLLDAGFYLQAAFGAEIAEITELTEPTDLVVSGIAVKIQNKIEKLGPMVSPPLLDLTIVEPPPAEPQPDYGLLFLPGVVLMALMFSAQGLSADFWAERESGTLRRLVSTPGLLSGFVLGKALAAGVIMGFIGGATLLLGFLYHDLVWNKLLPSVLWIAFAGIGLFAWFSALQMLLPTSKAANLFTTILVFPLLMMGGSFFPMEALPDWLAAIGRLSPNGFVVEKLSGELTSAGSWTFAMSSWGIVLAMTLSGLLICSWRLNTGFARK